MKILYKKDSSGRLRSFSIWTDGPILHQESGLVDGAKVPQRKICKGKNEGKSNATTSATQALLELESRYKKKLDEGYFVTQEAASAEEVLLPMLAKSLPDVIHKIKWETGPFAQPKLDGMRCLAVITDDSIRLLSRNGKEIESMPHIIESLKPLQENLRTHADTRWILDGELYANGLNFQSIMKLIKKQRPQSSTIKFHAYDMVLNKSFSERLSYLHSVIGNTPNIVKVDTVRVTSVESLTAFHTRCIELGYEGSIIRHTDEHYLLDTRSSQLLKNKDFIDIAAEIIDIIPGDQRETWGVPVLRYKHEDGLVVEFEAGARLTHEEREEFLSNKKEYIGQTAEIRFFEYLESRKPRFPIMVGIKLDC